MTYYEELGVEETASSEEIRRAYKHLVRLIHPDQCGHEATRRLADLQMKRLNGILEVLLDCDARLRYDRSLMALAFAVSGDAMPLPPGRWDPRWTAPVAASGGAVLLVLLLALSPLKPPASAPAVAPIAGAIPAREPKPVRHKTALPPRVRPVEPDIDWEPLVTYAYGSHVPVPPLPFPWQPPAAPTESAAAAKPAAGLAGDWLFVPTASINTLGFPPEHIELRLRPENGLLRGSYQARYRVTDRAISPNVAFQFEGPAGEEGGTLPWSGPGGSKGEVTLRLLQGGELEVKWEASQLGSVLGLESGTATLVRRPD